MVFWSVHAGECVSGTIRLSQSGRIIAVSEKVKHELIQLGTHPDKVQVIHNGVDIHEFYPSDTGEKSRMDINSGRVVGLFAGDISSPRKI